MRNDAVTILPERSCPPAGSPSLPAGAGSGARTPAASAAFASVTSLWMRSRSCSCSALLRPPPSTNARAATSAASAVRTAGSSAVDFQDPAALAPLQRARRPLRPCGHREDHIMTGACKSFAPLRVRRCRSAAAGQPGKHSARSTTSAQTRPPRVCQRGNRRPTGPFPRAPTGPVSERAPPLPRLSPRQGGRTVPDSTDQSKHQKEVILRG